MVARVVAAQDGSEKPMDSGQVRLEQLGYKQMLKRDLGGLSNFAFSFAVISILSGISLYYGIALNYGAPISMVYGWFVTGVFNFCLALSMAEICSAYPTSGGLYYWSYSLAGPSWGPFAAWMTGWFNVVGQWALTATAEFGLATLVQAVILLSTGGGNGGGYYANKYVVIGIFAGFLVIHTLVNCLPVYFLSFVGLLASIWNLVGAIVLTILLPLVATQRPSAKYVFTHFSTDSPGIHSKPYIFLLGALIGPFSFLGYDTSAHLAEETKTSDRNGAHSMWTAVLVSTIFGFGYLLGIIFATGDPQGAIDPGNDAKGYAIGQVFYEAFYSRYGNGTGGIVCLGAVGVAVSFASVAILTSNSRMVFAFSRDGALPGSRLWHSVNRRKVPFNALCLSAFIAFLIGLPSLGSVVAFQAMGSIATVAFYIAYALPVLFRITVARNTFIPGPFSMGKRVSLVVGWISVLFVVALTVLFCLPVAYPITSQTLNYTPVAFGSLLIITLSWWVLDARKWFKGPVRTLEESDIKKDPYPI